MRPEKRIKMKWANIYKLKDQEMFKHKSTKRPEICKYESTKRS